MRVSLVALLLGCRSGLPEPIDDAPLWVAEVAAHPERFADLLDRTGRDGWIAFHERRYEEAFHAFAGEGPAARRSRARAAFALGVLHDDLARLSGVAHERFFPAWQDRVGLPEGSVAPVIAALGSGCAGRDAGRWADADVAAPWDRLLRRLVDGADPLAVTDVPPWSVRVASWQDAPRERLVRWATTPLVVEDGGGFERAWYDPCAQRALARAWFDAAASELDGTDWRSAAAWAAPQVGLEAVLFAPWPDTGALASHVADSEAPGVLGAARVELGPIAPDGAPDAVQQARDDVRDLDARLAARRRHVLASAGDDGRALIEDLDLMQRYRQEALVARARRHLMAERPHMALATLELARDVASREVGAGNGPELHALLAEAHLRIGRTREALDALARVESVHPDVRPLTELVGDLAVLEGLGRTGDSKEN